MDYLITLAIIVGAALLLNFIFRGEPSGRDRSRDFNVMNGRWRVKYNDGKISEPMCRDVAHDYASMFGGTVIPRDPKP